MESNTRTRQGGKPRRRCLDAAQGDRPAGRPCSRLAAGLRFCTGRNAHVRGPCRRGVVPDCYCCAERPHMYSRGAPPRTAWHGHTARSAPRGQAVPPAARGPGACAGAARAAARRPVARVFLVNPRPPAGGTMAQETPMSILRRDESATHARGRHCCCLVGGPGACTHFARRSKLSRHAGLGLDGNDVMAGPSRSGPTQAPIRPSAFLVTREV